MQADFDLDGFLYSSELLRSTVQGGKLEECCPKLEQAVEDVDAEGGLLDPPPPHITSPLELLEYIYKENVLALRLLLILPVTGASGERSFSTLKRLKT